ncbi:MAG: DUF1275 family protein [Tissierellia bacterium]|nr:DUF1275 family protein [Tissierellia bacterium]
MEKKHWFFNFLTFIAGLINIFAIYYIGAPVTHHTGNLTQVMFRHSQNDWNLLIVFLLAIFLFFLGAFVDGLLFEGLDFNRQGARTVLRLLFLGFLCLGILDYLGKGEKAFLLFAPFALGMQNAIVLRQDGCVVRTTHMTGYLTDAGYLLGQWVKGVAKERKRIRLFLQGIFFFFLGGVFFVPLSFLFPAPFYYLFLISLLYFIALGFLKKK